MRTNIKTVLLFLVIMISIAIGGYYLKEILSNESEKVGIARTIKNNDIVTILLDSKSKIYEEINKMQKYQYTLEFIIYKYDNSDEITEIFLGFWPDADKLLTLKREEELMSTSQDLIFKYMENRKIGDKFSVLFNPEVTFHETVK